MTSIAREEREQTGQSPAHRMSGNMLRILTMLVFVPVTLVLVISGGWQLNIALLLMMGIALLELLYMFRFFEHLRHAPLKAAGILLSACLYAGLPLFFMISLRHLEQGLLFFIAAVFATWGTDICAYLTGRLFGKTHFVPKLSPGKTLEGAIGGVAGGILAGLIPFVVTRVFPDGILLLLVIAPFAAIAGDLLESAFKRMAQVKDSGIPGLNPFPGHGGVLDRIDALLAVMTLFYIFQGFIA